VLQFLDGSEDDLQMFESTKSSNEEDDISNDSISLRNYSLPFNNNNNDMYNDNYKETKKNHTKQTYLNKDSI